jgi:integral membrane protein (TIGR01906 family)
MKLLYRSLAWLVTILLPVALTFLGLRLLLTHAFPQIEYRLPGFPQDEYGFTMQDRLKWSQLSIDYLLNNAPISFLGDLTFQDGSPLFTARELSHMQDVKKVVQGALWVGYGVWAIMLGLGVWARFGGWWWQYVRGIWRGGWLTIGLVVVIGTLAATNFWVFFALFHSLFFAANSWEFLYSDTLIRLFPLPFWESAFGFAGGLDIAAGLALGIGLIRKRKEGKQALRPVSSRLPPGKDE